MRQVGEKPHIKLADRIAGDAQSIGSAILCMFPERLDFTTHQDIASARRVRWRHLSTPADTIRQAWVQSEGSQNAGRLPYSYSLAQIIKVDRQAMDQLQDMLGGTHAVTFKLGTTVMMGSSTKHEIFGLEDDDAEDYTFAMGIGNGDLEVGAGVHWGKNNLYYGSPMYQGLNHGVRPGEIMPKSEIPTTIPLL